MGGWVGGLVEEGSGLIDGEEEEKADSPSYLLSNLYNRSSKKTADHPPTHSPTHPPTYGVLIHMNS